MLIVIAFLKTPQLAYAVLGSGSLLCAVIYAVRISRDWRKRRVYFDRTMHLSAEDVDVAFQRNLEVVAAYANVRPGKKPALRTAENAMVMTTVLAEHRARLSGQVPPHSYLKARRATLQQARMIARPAPTTT